ncbi:MAG: ice-binding family protein [Actinophytocola sp.]|uniref:ice-binding family protein n=1 Tax=Actinophytocola sp. TaxID=1872138 RepID=UPI003C77DF51
MGPAGIRRVSATRLGLAAAMTVLGTTLFLTGGVLPQVASAATAPVELGTAGTYSVLAGSTITNTGPTVLDGDLGLSPGTGLTGFPPGVVNGTTEVANAAAATAKTDLTTAYGDAAGRATTTTVPTELGNTTLTDGVYDSADGTFSITGVLTLDGLGDANSVFIFKTAATLTTASGSAVNLVNGARADHVFWQVGDFATLGVDSSLAGSVLALTSITAGSGADVTGRLLVIDGGATLEDNTISSIFELSITATETAFLGVGDPGDTITGQLGPVTVDAVGITYWTATVSTTSFTITGGPTTIANSAVSYWAGPATTQVGTDTATSGQLTEAEAVVLDGEPTAFTMVSGANDTTVSWNPTLVISVPSSAVAGTYTGTVTHSVA